MCCSDGSWPDSNGCPKADKVSAMVIVAIAAAVLIAAAIAAYSWHTHRGHVLAKQAREAAKKPTAIAVELATTKPAVSQRPSHFSQGRAQTGAAVPSPRKVAIDINASTAA